MAHRGQRLQHQREALGLSRAELAAETRIPEEHIAALEEGRLRDLPAGPYVKAWMETLEDRVGLSSTEFTASMQGRQGAVPFKWVRLVAGVSFLGLVAVVAWRFSDTVQEAGDAITSGAAAEKQEILVRARSNSRVRVRLDEGPMQDLVLAGGQERQWEADRRIELDVYATDALRIHYNGHLIVPQGRQDEHRTLVFEDDLGYGAP